MADGIPCLAADDARPVAFGVLCTRSSATRRVEYIFTYSCGATTRM